MTEYEFASVPDWIKVNGQFDNTCLLSISKESEVAGNDGRLKLALTHHGGASVISNARVIVKSKSGNIHVFIGANDAEVIFGLNSSGAYDLRLWRKSTVKIGDDTTSNGTRIVCDMSEVEVGRDCMFSDGILIQSADQHGIVDLETGQIINEKMRKTVIGHHVWIGRQSTLMGDVSIGDGAIIGTGAIVTRDIPQTSIAVGIPAKVIKSKMTWSRSPIALDAMARKLVELNKQQI